MSKLIVKLVYLLPIVFYVGYLLALPWIRKRYEKKVFRVFLDHVRWMIEPISKIKKAKENYKLTYTEAIYQYLENYD